MIHPHRDVVVALIWRQGALLTGLRGEGAALPLLWEFPGGKKEGSETHEEALVRECHEELDVAVVVGPKAFAPVAAEGAHGPLMLHFYHAALKDPDATPKPLTTLALEWVRPERLHERPFCPADTALIEALAKGQIAPWTAPAGPVAPAGQQSAL